MPELIDRKYLLAYLSEIKPDEYVSAFGEAAVQVIGLIEEFVKEMPTIEAEPVRHSCWIHDINNLYGCALCGNRETMSNKKKKNYDKKKMCSHLFQDSEHITFLCKNSVF